MVLRDREPEPRERSAQNFEIRSWSAAVTPGIAAREASAMAPSCAIFIKIYAWALGARPTRVDRIAVLVAGASTAGGAAVDVPSDHH